MKMKISPAVAVIGVYFALCGRIYLFISYIAALILHELAHAGIAGRQGFVMREMKLTPFGASLGGNFEGMPPSDEIKIALAGPCANLFTGLVFTGLWWTFPELYFFTHDFASANFALAAFNLIPAHPLDGGRVFYAFLHSRIRRAHIAVKTAGLIFSAVFFAAFFFTLKKFLNPTLLLAAIFMLAGALKPDKNAVYRHLYDKIYRTEKFARGLPVKVFAVMKHTPLKRLKKLMSPDYYSVFRVMDGGVTVSESDFDYTAPGADKLAVSETEIYKKRENSAKTLYFS